MLVCFLHRFVAFLSLDRFWLKGPLIDQRFRAASAVHMRESEAEVEGGPG